METLEKIIAKRSAPGVLVPRPAGPTAVLMEKVIRKRHLDLEKARERFQLSKEAEVLRLVCRD